MNAGRRDVRSLFDLYNVNLRKDALDYLTEITKSMESEERRKHISNIITRLRSELLTIQSLDLETLKKLLFASRSGQDEYREDFHVVNLPTDFCHIFNAKANVLEQKERSSLAAEFKQTNFMQRRMMNILNTIDHTHERQRQIKPIEQLFVDTVCKATILATVKRVGGNQIMAEDLTGAIPIEFSGTKMSGWLPFEGGCFLFEGQQMDGVFTVDDVYLPVSKLRDQMPKLEIGDVFNRSKFTECTQCDRIVILSDIWLDTEKVFTSLNNMFVSFSENPPAMFIFCGSFHSNKVGINYLSTEIENFKRLARLISNYSATYPNTKYIFVPSAEDLPGTPIMPRYSFLPAVKKTFTNQKNVYFATNPCRILYKNRVISVVRENIVEKLSGSSLCAHMQGIDVVQSFVDTIWSQRHLCPLLPSISPTTPQFDDALLLQFNPDLLVLADKFMPFFWSPEQNQPGAGTVNPGSFGVNSTRVMVYWPRTSRLDMVSITDQP